MKEPSYCKGCVESMVSKHSGWECDMEANGCCVDGSEYVSKGDAQLSQYPEERKEG